MHTTELDAVAADGGRSLSYTRVVARRRAETPLEEPIESVAAPYSRQPLLPG